MEKTMRPGMSNEEIIEIMIEQRVNERFAKMKAELYEGFASLSAKNQASVGGEQFYRIQSYISTLVQVQGANHDVHKEMNEAILKLKELAYQG